ncbi:MAG TPA: hypothetical protein VKS79_12105 [Gemmataceae bacterium]|nr:hypothetical protein [Gemmataceae bacterium]
MHKQASQRRWISPLASGFVAMAVLGTALLSPRAGRADFTITSGNQSFLHPPADSINFPSTDPTSLSVPFAARFNPTSQASFPAPGEGQTIPGNFFYFNGYDASNNPEILHESHGTAAIQAVDSSTPPKPTLTMTDLTIVMRPLAGFGITGFDFQGDFAGSAGNVTLTAFDQLGNTTSATFTADLTGQQKFLVLATNGEFLTDLEITTSGGAVMNDFKQGDYQAVATPEPASLTLSAIGLAIGMGYYGLRRRRTGETPNKLA